MVQASIQQQPQPIIKSGIYSHLMMDMDDATFQRHLRLNREQFELLNRTLGELGMEEAPTAIGTARNIAFTYICKGA